MFDYSSYERVLNFMTAEMNANANGAEAQEIRELNEKAVRLALEAAGTEDVALRGVMLASANTAFAFGLWLEQVEL